MIQRIKDNVFAMNSLILFSGSMFANVLNYLFHLFIGRMVSVEIYGEIESLVSLIGIVSVPAMTLGMVATKYAACSKADCNAGESKEIWKYLNKKIFKYGLPLFVLALIVTPYVREFMNIESNLPVIFIWIMMFLSFFASINNGILSGWQKFKDTSWVGIWGSMVKLIGAVILIKLGFALNGAIGSFLLGGIASYIASVLMLKFIIRAENKKEGNLEKKFDTAELKRYILPAFAATLAITILGNVDMVIAKHNLDAMMAGQYGALTIVSKIIFFATGVIGAVLFSMSAEDSHKKNNPMLIFRNASYLMLFVSISAMIIYFVFPELVLSILFGNKYAAVAGYLGWFAILVTLYSFVNLIMQYLMSIHQTSNTYIMLAIAILATVLAMFIGSSISAILWIMVIAQIAAILTGFYFIFNSRENV